MRRLPLLAVLLLSAPQGFADFKSVSVENESDGLGYPYRRSQFEQTLLLVRKTGDKAGSGDLSGPRSYCLPELKSVSEDLFNTMVEEERAKRPAPRYVDSKPLEQRASSLERQPAAAPKAQAPISGKKKAPPEPAERVSGPLWGDYPADLLLPSGAKKSLATPPAISKEPPSPLVGEQPRLEGGENSATSTSPPGARATGAKPAPEPLAPQVSPDKQHSGKKAADAAEPAEGVLIRGLKL